MRRNRAGLKRIGLLALALVIALGTMGVAYSLWTEEIYIDSTVYTGTLDVDISGVSSTFAYKAPGEQYQGLPPETYVYYDYGGTPFIPPDGWILVASAVTVDTSLVDDDVDSATMTFSGIFPGIDFITDLELEYRGTIPAKISFAEVVPLDVQDPNYNAEEAEIVEDLCALGESSGHTEGIWVDADLSTDDGANWTPVADPLGLQLHRWDLVHLTVHVLLPEDDPAYENLSISFKGLISVIQWNLYEEP